jgi:hypothetical protein
MLSGFFLKIGAKENSLGQIIMPKDHFLFNLDSSEIKDDYLKYKHLHYIFLDGSVEYLEDQRFKKISKEINIYYVGKLDSFWKKIKNAHPLFSDDINENLDIIEQVKINFPIFFKKYFIKKSLTTIYNFNKVDLFFKHIFGKKKYVYYGYIRPIKSHLKKYQQILNLDYNEIENFFYFQSVKKYDLEFQICYICDFKNILIKRNKSEDLPYINELILFMIRYAICTYLSKSDDFIIYDGLGGKKNYNVYEMFFGKHHTYLDFGSKVGFDKIYPRKALLLFSKKKNISFNISENFLFKDLTSSNLYLKQKVHQFFDNLNVKL